jgi:acyl-CoA thioester hydrolase
VILYWRKTFDFKIALSIFMNSTEKSVITINSSDERWFEYPIKVFPHHTDYGGMVWHGTYLIWLEEARVECLSSIGVDFADFVANGVDLPVVEIKSVKYRYPLRLGQKAIVKTRMSMEGLKVLWEYKIESFESGDSKIHMTCLLALAAIDRDTGRILRRLPPSVQSALEQLSSRFL